MNKQNNNKIEDIMNSAIEKIKDIVDTQTVVGKQIATPNGFVIPLTKVSIGFVAGGGEYSAEEKNIKTTGSYPFAGGTGSGVCILPLGFLVCDNGKINLIKLDDKTPLEKIIDTVPTLASVITNAIKENKSE